MADITGEKLIELLKSLGLEVPEGTIDPKDIGTVKVEVTEDIPVDGPSPEDIELSKKAFKAGGPYVQTLYKLGAALTALTAAMAQDTVRLSKEPEGKREDIAHDLLHATLEMMLQMVEKCEESMPCLNHGEEKPKGCSVH